MDDVRFEEELEKLAGSSPKSRIADVSRILHSRRRRYIIGYSVSVLFFFSLTLLLTVFTYDNEKVSENVHLQSKVDGVESSHARSTEVEERASAPVKNSSTLASSLQVDPNGILVMHLTDEEAKAFGIHRIAGGITSLHQSLVTDEYNDVGDKLGCDTTNPDGLFTCRKHVRRFHEDSLELLTCDGAILDGMASVLTAKVDSIHNLHIKPMSSIRPAIVNQELGDLVSSSLSAVAYGEKAVDNGYYIVSDSDSRFQPSKKPFYVKQVEGAGPCRFLTAFMPTEEAWGRIPERFLPVFRRLYGVYIPDKPKKYVPDTFNVLRKAKLVKKSAPAGQPTLRLTNEELRKLMIFVNNGSVYHWALGGWAVDPRLVQMDSMKFSNRHRFNAVFIEGDSIMLRSGTDTVAYHWPTHLNTRKRYPKPVSVALQVTPSDPLEDADGSFSMVVLASKHDGIEHLSRLASRISMAIADIPSDSIAYYHVAEGGVEFPVASLFVPVGIETDGIQLNSENDTMYRVEGCYYYLPTPEFIEALPHRIQDYVRVEYQGIMEYLEERLTSESLCNKLEQPSFVKLCEVEDSPFAIESCGPIPVSDEIVLRLNARGSHDLEIKVHNSEGNVIQVIRGRTLHEGANEVLINASSMNLSNGVYYLSVSSSESTATTRFLYQK